MRRNLLGNLLGLVFVALLVTVPLVAGAFAVSDAPSDPHAGHDMSTMNQSDMSTTNQADQLAGHGSGSGNNHDSSNYGGHGEGEASADTPPNWPVIYGFGAFNLLVIIAAALMKNRVTQRNEVN